MGSFKGDSCVVARKAESASLLQMVIIVVVIAASCGLIIMYSLLSFIYHFECVTYIQINIAHLLLTAALRE